MTCTLCTILGDRPVPCRRRERKKLGVEMLEVIRAKATQQDATDAGHDVAVHHPLVSGEGGGPELEFLRGEPRVDQVHAERETAGRHLGVSQESVLLVEAVDHRIGIRAVDSRSVPRASLLTSDRVDPVVDHRVEPFTTLHHMSHRSLRSPLRSR